MSKLDSKQILLLNGMEYEIVPLGNGRWISKNEYELMRQLNSVYHTSSPQAATEVQREKSPPSKKERANTEPSEVNHETVTKLLATKIAEKSSDKQTAAEDNTPLDGTTNKSKRRTQEESESPAKRQRTSSDENGKDNSSHTQAETCTAAVENGKEPMDGANNGLSDVDEWSHEAGETLLDSNENGINAEDGAVIIEGKKHFPLLKQLLKPPLVQ